MPRPRRTKVERSEEEKVNDLIESASEYIGPAAGAGLGMFLAGPAGAILGQLGGTAIQQVFARVGADLSDRFLSHREQVKLGATLVYAIARLKANMDAGLPSWGDYDISKNGERPKAEEILEGVLLKAKTTYEEKKLPYLGNFYGNAPYHGFAPAYDMPGVGYVCPASEAPMFLRQADELSYRQYVCLAMVGQRAAFPLPDHDYRGPRGMSFQLVGILYEIFDLIAREHLTMMMPNSQNFEAILENRGVVPSRLRLTNTGSILYGLLGLADLPIAEIEDMVVPYLASP
jgi:hypothetical protein